jgi:DNA polymerase III alpha subunit
MQRVLRGFRTAVVLLLMCAFPSLAQHAVSVQALTQDPGRYDGKVVAVVGTITAYRERVSDAGNPYTTFRLTDGVASVAVFIWNKQGLSNGQKVLVTGAFAQVGRTGTSTYDNEIQAHRIEPVP